MMTAEQLAQFFHESYERLAPQFGYKTRKESAKPWADVPEQNRKLMTAVCAEVLTQAAAQLAEKEREIERLKNKCDLMIRQDREEVWYWADDGEDHPESLACPALIKPDVVRRFVAAEQRLQEAQAWKESQLKVTIS
jgi:hypothetical protein